MPLAQPGRSTTSWTIAVTSMFFQPSGEPVSVQPRVCVPQPRALIDRSPVSDQSGASSMGWAQIVRWNSLLVKMYPEKVALLMVAPCGIVTRSKRVPALNLLVAVVWGSVAR